MLDPKNDTVIARRPGVPALAFEFLGDVAGVHGYREFQHPALTRFDHSLFAPLCVEHIRFSCLPAQHDVSHPDSQRELIVRIRLGVETCDFGDEIGSPHRLVSADRPSAVAGSQNQIGCSCC